MSNPSGSAGIGPTWSAPTAPAPAGALRNGGWAGLTGLVLGAGMLVIVALVRVIVGIPKVSEGYYNALYRTLEDRPVIWLILGLLMLVSIVPIAAGVVLGHLGLRRAKQSGTGAGVSGIAIGVGYTLVIFWGVRLINAITNAAVFPTDRLRLFIEHLGLWA